MQGNIACAEGALVAGCRFFAGYPITPSNEIAEWMSRRLPELGGNFIQMEDEIASIVSIIGASCAGVKSMTATSGPGFSLMMENIGLGIMYEAPCVIVNVQRAGPSTGIPTLVGQGDMMQARWGSHGDYEMITYVPNSVQEMFELTIKAFNAAEHYRQPVTLLSDQMVGHMYGRITVPPLDQIHIENRKLFDDPSGPSRPNRGCLPFDSRYEVPPMPLPGNDYRFHFTGLTHDDRGYPRIEHEVSMKLIGRLISKIRDHAKEIAEVELFMVEDAEIILVAYGCVSRSAYQAVKDARNSGIKCGMVRLITAWPFPEDTIWRVSQQAKVILVPEINMGQMVHPVKEASECLVISVPYAPGAVPTPNEILGAIKTVSK